MGRISVDGEDLLSSERQGGLTAALIVANFWYEVGQVIVPYFFFFTSASSSVSLEEL